jgi:hypothetical protein
MRPIEILLVTLSVLVIMLAGFAPLFPSEPPERRIKHECRLFYGPSGDVLRSRRASIEWAIIQSRQTNHRNAQAQFRS